MADITVTDTAVALVTDGTLGMPTQCIQGISAAAILVGQTVYRDSTGRYRPCVVTDSVASNVVGIAVSKAAAAGQLITIAVEGDITLGAVLTSGVPANVGVGAGGITITGADVTTGWYPALVGVCMSTTRLRLATGGGRSNEGFNHA